MAEVIVVYGKSGAGKSRSLLNFGEDEILLIKTIDKRLPFKKQFRYTLVTDDINLMLQQMNKMPCRTAVIDDAGFLMTNKFMAEHSTPKFGADQFKLYNEIADTFFTLVNGAKALPDWKTVYIILHEEESDVTGSVKLKTIGKLLDQKCPIESMVTVVLRCLIGEGGKHIFRTQNSGNDVSKSPEGMLPEIMENDLKAVDNAIREYWGLETPAESVKNAPKTARRVEVTQSSTVPSGGA